jgi:hypothetical protein
MGRVRAIGLCGAAVAAIMLLGAAQLPKALAQTSPGLWEVSGLPNSAAPLRQCIADTAMLARLEHRGQHCTQTVISDTPATTVIEYKCSQGGFGQSKLTLITPRSLRIETQGISAGYPFNYVIQARRVANCDVH